jgi:polyadenylate-binding protein
MLGGSTVPFHSASLYVGDLATDASEGLLFEIFNTVGPVASIRVCRDAVTRRSLGYAYVNFHNVSDAERALDTMNYTLIKSKPCRIMWSQRDPTLRKSGVGNVFVKNLDASIDHKALFDTFSLFGNILSCKVATDEAGRSQGYGYVHYESEDAATDAINKINSMTICDKEVYVGHFVRRTERSGQSDWTNLYVKNFPADWDEETLRKAFETFGAITSCKVQPPSKAPAVVKPATDLALNAEARAAAREAAEQAKRAALDAGDEAAVAAAEEALAAVCGEEADAAEAAAAADGSAFGWVNFEAHDAAVAAMDALNGIAELPGQAGGAPTTLKAPLFVGRAQKKIERERELKAKFDAAKIERIKKYQGVNLFVKNLDDGLDDDQLRENFAEYGTITSARVMREPATGTSRGFGFVCFSSPEEAAKAVTEMNNKLVLGKPIFVALAQRKEVRRAQLEAQHAQRRTTAPYGAHPGAMGPAGVPPHAPQGLHPAHLGAPYGTAMPIMYAAGAPNGHPMGMTPQGHPGVPIAGVPPNARGYVMARGSPRGPMTDPRAGFGHGGAPRQGGYPMHPGQMQQMSSQGGSNRRSRNRGGQGGQGQGAQQYKYTQNARNAANMPPSIPQLPPQAHLMPATVGQQPGQGFPGGPGVAPPMPPLPLQQPPPAGANQPRRTPEDPLTLSALANASPTLQKNMIGERLYPLIHHTQPELAGKITGMLLEMDNSELLHLLESPDALRMKVAEALEVLKQHQAQLQQGPREDAA